MLLRRLTCCANILQHIFLYQDLPVDCEMGCSSFQFFSILPCGAGVKHFGSGISALFVSASRISDSLNKTLFADKFRLYTEIFLFRLIDATIFLTVSLSR